MPQSWKILVAEKKKKKKKQTEVASRGIAYPANQWHRSLFYDSLSLILYVKKNTRNLFLSPRFVRWTIDKREEKGRSRDVRSPSEGVFKCKSTPVFFSCFLVVIFLDAKRLAFPAILINVTKNINIDREANKYK